MRLRGLVLELRPRVRRRLRNRGPRRRVRPAARALRPNASARSLRSVGTAVADPRRLPKQADREPGQARLRSRPAGQHRPHQRDVRDAPRHRPDRVERRTEREAPSIGISPHCDLSPTISQAADGSRIEQPVSVPSARSHRPAASAAAEPLDEPPVVLPGWAGLLHVPYHWLAPRTLQANSGRCVLPTSTAPASSRRWTATAFRVGHVLPVDARAVGRPDPGGVEEVLDAERAAGERARTRLSRIDAGDERVPAVLGHDGISATASISTFAPGTASRETSTSVLAGRASPKTSCRTGLIFGRSSTSVR